MKTRELKFFSLLLILMMIIPTMLNVRGVEARPVETSAKEEVIRIMPFDKIDIQIYPQVEQNVILEVNKSGSVFFSFLGDVSAKGLTPEQLAKKFTKLLSDGYFRDPHVAVSVLKENHVVVMGSVQNPQTIPLTTGRITFIEAIAMAGGFAEATDLRRVKVVSRSGNKTETKTFNAKSIMDGSEADFLLKNGDVVIVPAVSVTLKENQIVVMGHIMNPQTIPVDQNDLTFIQVVAMAGGFAELARVTKVKVVRRESGKTRTIYVNAKKIMNGKEDDFLMKPGDVIIVPERYF